MRFLFDFLSPYAYVAWPGVLTLGQTYGETLEVEPVLLAGLLGAHGTKGPAEVPAKRLYTFKDVYRKAVAAGLTLLPPPAHPFNPLLALRVVQAAEAADRVALTSALWRGVWGGGGGVEDVGNVTRLAIEAGLDGADLVRRAGTAEVKDALRAQTERAAQAGVFGVPTVIVGGEMYWGTDALPFVAMKLEGRDPVDESLLARWRDLPATARRQP